MTNSRTSQTAGIALLLAALFGSGVASIINQVIWQRALKIYLAGSEAISAMIVVLVFMLGLGVGAQIMGRRARRIADPLRAFAAIELALCLGNLGICWLLSLDVRQSLFALQKLVLSLGIPLRVLYAVIAAFILSGPCILMGMTVPVASEGCQRQLGFQDNRFLSRLFFLNTLGALGGALLSGFVILPLLGQQAGLLLAVSMNGVACCLAGWLAWRVAQARPSAASSTPDARRPARELSAAETDGDVRASSTDASHSVSLRPALLLGFSLGLLSLAYEMQLFRMGALINQPLPWMFSLVLAAFLLTWSLGVGLAEKLPVRLEVWLACTALSVGAIPWLYRLARWETAAWSQPVLGKIALFGLCFVPCFFFGVLFAQVIARFARSWGQDVGFYFAANTFGSCLGVVLGTLVGFEFALEFLPWAIFAGLVGLLLASRFWASMASQRLHIAAVTACLVLAAIQLGWWASRGYSVEPARIVDAYYGPGGVVEIDQNGNLSWDGLWHSSLSRDGNHIGSNNWQLAVFPLLCHAHAGMRPLDVCVIGLGTGITAGTLADSALVQSVDSYEINAELQQMIRDYPDGTLHVAAHPKIQHFWRDGRSGLALNEQRYDLITQQPLYLKQAGSSLLLSREYMELVRRRLKPGGVFCIYCNALGNDDQARMVRATAADVFADCESFGDGYMIVASDQPIRFSAEILCRRLDSDPVLRKQCESYGMARLVAAFDRPRLEWESPYLVTDGHPLVEYPPILKFVFGGRGN